MPTDRQNMLPYKKSGSSNTMAVSEFWNSSFCECAVQKHWQTLNDCRNIPCEIIELLNFEFCTLVHCALPLCDLIWHVISRSGVVISITNCYIRFTLLLLSGLVSEAQNDWRDASQLPFLVLSRLYRLSSSVEGLIMADRMPTTVNYIYSVTDRTWRQLLGDLKRVWMWATGWLRTDSS